MDDNMNPVAAVEELGPELNEDEHSSLVNSILDGVSKSPVFIDDLPDAVVNGQFTAAVGDYIVIEKWLTIAQKTRWLGTSFYKITHVSENGNISLHDEELCQSAQANWRTGPAHGWRFKLATPQFSFTGRDKQEFADKHTQRVARAAAGEPAPVKRKPGRPKGSVSKDPARAAAKKAKEDAIKKRRAERKAKKAEREAKRAAKEAKKKHANIK